MLVFGGVSTVFNRSLLYNYSQDDDQIPLPSSKKTLEAISVVYVEPS